MCCKSYLKCSDTCKACVVLPSLLFSVFLHVIMYLLFSYRKQTIPSWPVFFTTSLLLVSYQERPSEIYLYIEKRWPLLALSYLFSCPPLFYPSILLCIFFFMPLYSEGEESRRFIKTLIGRRSKEETSLTPILPTHPWPHWSRRRGYRPRAPPSPPRPLRFLSDGVARTSRFLSNRERHGGGNWAGASAQKVRFPGYQLPHVTPGNTCWQCSDGPPTWTQTPVQREVGTQTHENTHAHT